ncbi:4'-phosphopantetheinyl transferase family protein [Janibacter sp. GS2]|uniref:4'-phosphopantetheinyl transferase family protein n=1 Tax=Janibacter sp. GS2 TaxID=3442646 RepID=UPI003EB7E3A2
MSDLEPAPPGPVVWWADLTAADLSLVAWLDPDERARLAGIDRVADRGRFLVGAALLRVAVASATGRPRVEVVVTRTCSGCGQPHGAPRVAGTAVSVAHASGLVAVATAAGLVGVDVERVDRGGDMTAWVRDEARYKATSAVDGRAPAMQTVPLTPPLPGYRAAVVLPASETGAVVVHDPATSARALRG